MTDSISRADGPAANIYAGGGLDRASLWRSDDKWILSQLDRPEARLVPLSAGRVAIFQQGGGPVVAMPRAGDYRFWLRNGWPLHFLGLRDGSPLFVIDLPDDAPAPAIDGSDAQFTDLREVGAILPHPDASLLAYARALTHWHHTHRFCGRCGSPTESRQGGHMRQCLSADCAAQHFPRTDPAVIMLVIAGDHCLLGRQARWRPGMFSALAGFVEPGESFEEAVAREVMEETGIPIRHLRYHSSQPWPFPGNVMIGFHVSADRSPLRIDHNELETADWFTRDDIRAFDRHGRSLPNADSIARRRVEDWVEGRIQAP
ncbi:MAG: NAD(+) diphosphatase [Telmatospirillum sp.]|nr:NAD(+) diphosphatase [Telmatospirillum sp.]